MPFERFCFFVVLVLQLEHYENAKILSIFPLPAPSHFTMFSKILEELVRRGHEVDVLTPLPSQRNITRLNFIKLPNVLTRGLKVATLTIEQQRKISFNEMMNMMFADYNLCQLLFDLDEMIILKKSSKQYDLLILEPFITDCLFGYAHVFKVPVVAFTSSVDMPWGAYKIGNPDNPAYIPTYFSNYGSEMTLYERVVNTIILIYTKFLHNVYQQIQEHESRNFFGKEVPSLDQLVSKTILFVVNSHFSLNQARPNVPNVIEVAGLHIGQPKPLEKNLQEYIGDSKFIYFSLGTLSNPSTIPSEKLRYIYDIFKELGYKVLWRGNKDALPKEISIPENIYFEEWMPQLDILCHPNILFFITHNGLMGTQEAVYCGVPMLSIPLFADQFLNARNMQLRSVAIIIHLETISKNELQTSMKRLIENPKFRENAKNLSQQFKDRPFKPLDEGVYWIEYVLRYKGAPQLRSKSADLAWYQYHLLDVLLVVLFTATLCISLLYALIKYIWILANSIRISIKIKSK